eukprot:GHVS01058317.1.p2 GENE.GHVS01058317.1~~GHVS01058317.1.p2  ORF type:complete len:135 (-),score=34.04 GHVS01058317.1:151-555(-)
MFPLVAPPPLSSISPPLCPIQKLHKPLASATAALCTACLMVGGEEEPKAEEEKEEKEEEEKEETNEAMEEQDGRKGRRDRMLRNTAAEPNNILSALYPNRSTAALPYFTGYVKILNCRSPLISGVSFSTAMTKL